MPGIGDKEDRTTSLGEGSTHQPWVDYKCQGKRTLASSMGCLHSHYSRESNGGGPKRERGECAYASPQFSPSNQSPVLNASPILKTGIWVLVLCRGYVLFYFWGFPCFMCPQLSCSFSVALLVGPASPLLALILYRLYSSVYALKCQADWSRWLLWRFGMRGPLCGQVTGLPKLQFPSLGEQGSMTYMRFRWDSR